jgi:two-component system chemotaxis response regulator CheB
LGGVHVSTVLWLAGRAGVSTAVPDPAARTLTFEMVAIAASAGGITALSTVLGKLPLGFPVPVLVVQHLDPRHDTVIAHVLGRRTTLPVELAGMGRHARAGTIYVAPPNHHLLVGAGGVLTLSSSELVHFVRPSADILFESVARTYGNRALGCVLTGSGRDGATGAGVIKSAGGTLVVEDPASAQFPSMPTAAIAEGDVDFVLPLEDIGPEITRLVEGRTP